MSKPNPYVGRFMKLFSGLDTAYGTGEGRWIHEKPTRVQFSEHLAGQGPGLGIAPLRSDATVTFAAIDLDEPDFDTARELAALVPGTAFIERSRSGNAHIFVFFSEPVEAWVPRGILRACVAAIGKRHVEVFPKQDKLRLGMVGNYVNLPYYGDTRKVIMWNEGRHKSPLRWHSMDMSLETFIDDAEQTLNSPSDWRKRAHWLDIKSPVDRETSDHEFGTQPYLHRCAEYLIEHHEDNPIMEGHRAVVYFALSKMLANCALFDRDESLAILNTLNEESPDPISDGELHRIYMNAERGEFRSTGCDDPLFLPYADPDCPIANGEVND